MRRIFLIIIAVLIIVMSVSKCGTSNNDKSNGADDQTTYTVKAKPLVKPLYFSGTINPYNYSSILSPVEGVVDQMEFHYGQSVTKGQVLFVLDSPKLQQDFQDALSAYLKALDDYRDKSRKFEGSKNLRELEFISDEDYYNDKNAKDESYMAMLQAKVKLEATLDNMGLSTDLDKYKQLGREKIIQTLLKKWDKIEVTADQDGIALSPIGADGKSGGSDSKSVGPGSEVKDGQILLTIGDLSGISIAVNVNEIDVNKIQPGQVAKVTGPAFPGIELEGKVAEVDKQAQGGDSGLPTFPVVVKVKKLTDAQKEIIHVGMSAKVEIDLSTDKTITVPIKAVFQKDDKSYVNVEDSKSQEIKPVEIKTGQTTESDVIVVDGLKEGDVVVYNP